MVNRNLLLGLVFIVSVLAAPLLTAFPASARTSATSPPAAPVTSAQTVSADDADYATATGWFYSQTGSGNGNGYSVLDADTDARGQTIKFWTAFQRLGGVAKLGYPVSQPYVGSDGLTYQAFQGGVLQWRPELDDAVLANTFDMLQDAGKGEWLSSVKGLPEPIADDGSGGDFQKALATRMGWLTDEAIKEKVLSNPNPQSISTWNDALALQLYGLPKSRPEQHGPFVSQLFQRISVQRWTAAVPGMPPVGSVTVVLGGDLLKEAGLIPASATQVQGPGGIEFVSAKSSFPWALKQTGAAANCGTTSFSVVTLDASGWGVNGLTIRSWNDFGNLNETSTRANNGANGYMDRAINAGPSKGTWYVMLVDGQGRQSSNTVTLTFTDTCDPSKGAVNQIALELRQEGAALVGPPPGSTNLTPDQAALAAATPVPSPYPWVFKQTGTTANCGPTYFTVRALDANGVGTNGLVIRSWNDDGNVSEESTRNGNGSDGYMDRVVSSGPGKGKWYVELVDGAGLPSSNVLTLDFTDTCDPAQGAVNQIALELRQGGSVQALPQQGAPAPAPTTINYPWHAAVTAGLPNCGTTYVRALVLSANGQGLNGYDVRTWNDQGDAATVKTANHNGVDGYAERVFGSGTVPGTWHLMLVDGAGQQASNIVNFTFTGDCDQSNTVQQVEVTIRPK